jgi:hypothetical protein
MKKYLFLLVILFSYSFFMASHQTPSSHTDADRVAWHNHLAGGPGKARICSHRERPDRFRF